MNPCLQPSLFRRRKLSWWANARHRYSKKKLNIAEVAHADEVQFVHFAEKADSS
ncbi:hypothetical protein OAF56_02725 [Pirellulaceae bacterium]|jgi:hypothetical protein|nr:hypothetical protein [Pirellulaceae bacterium]